MVWGTGTPRREFLYVDDMADACVHLMKTYSDTALVNIGTGKDITIADFARVVAAVVGFKGSISFDRSRPDGTPRKLLDVSRLTELGWRATTSLEVGVGLAYQAFLREAATQSLVIIGKGETTKGHSALDLVEAAVSLDLSNDVKAPMVPRIIRILDPDEVLGCHESLTLLRPTVVVDSGEPPRSATRRGALHEKAWPISEVPAPPWLASLPVASRISRSPVRIKHLLRQQYVAPCHRAD